MDVQTFLNTNAAPVPFALLSLDGELVRDIQGRLSELGLLDPPVDGNFGPISVFALETLCHRAQLSVSDGFSAEVARALVDESALDLFPIRPKNDLAGQLVRTMQALGHWIGHGPGFRTIVYIEGCDKDGSPNDDARNKFNDSRFVFTLDEGGTPVVLGAWEGTTEPGAKFTINPENPDGAARIAFGQHKSWVVGTHKKGTSSEQEALVQAENVTVFRDLNKDFEREGDKTFTGLFGINQHHGFNHSVDDIGTASAGCLVGRTKTGHLEFMKLVKQDPRFGRSNGYRFMSTVLPVSEMQGKGQQEDEDMATVVKLRKEEIVEDADRQLWLYAGGQKRKIVSIPELEELKSFGLLDGRETPLSRAALNAIPVMQGAAV